MVGYFLNTAHHAAYARSTLLITRRPYHAFKTARFSPPFLDISNRSDHADGYLFFAPDGATAFQTAPVIMDSRGELVWNGPDGHAFSFGVQTYQHEKVLVSWHGSSFPEPVGRGNGAVVLWNKHYEQIAEVLLPGNFMELTPGDVFASNVDLHEIFITPENTMVVTANNATQADLTNVGGNADGWIVEAQVYEIDVATNEVLFEWKSLDHRDDLPLNASVYPLGSEGYDGSSQQTAWGYFHINAASRYQDGFILSSRYLSSAIAIDSRGEIKWRLQGMNGGEFTLGDGADFRYQHHIRVVEEHNSSCVKLRLHDNHNCPIDNGKVPSSGKLITVNLETKEATLVRRFLNESGPIFPTAQGSFHEMDNGNYFTGNGWIPVLEEFSPEGQILNTIQFGEAVARVGGGFESGGRGTLSYRAFNQKWTGCPKTRPSVVAEPIGDKTEHSGVKVYVSWNGATNVDSWAIYGGNDTMSYITTVQKTGFETVIDAPAVQFVQVRPISAHRDQGCEQEDVDSELISVIGA